MRACFVTILAPIVLALASGFGAADKFQKLNGGQLRAKLAGMELTDGVHWRDVFERNWTLAGYSMGRKTAGKWNIRRDQLCLDRGKDPGSGCYDVWMSGTSVELRPEGRLFQSKGNCRSR
jgi:hypothetical protein